MLGVNKIEQIKLIHIQELLNVSRTQAYYLKTKQRGLSLLDSMLISQYEPDNELIFYNWYPSELLFWNNIENLQDLLMNTDLQMAEHFNISKKKYSYFRSLTKSLPWENCEYFYKKYDLNPIHFLTHDIDLKCLSKVITSAFTKTSFLPSTLDGGGSKMRTLSNCFDYIKQEIGAKQAKSLLQALQISEHSLSFADKNISIKIFSILHEKLRMYRKDDSFFIEMGAYNKKNKSNKIMAAQALPKQLTKANDIFQFAIENLVSRVDINREYKLESITSLEFKMRITPTEIFKKAFFPNKPFCEYETYLYILGHMRVIPTYFNLKEINDIKLQYDSKSGQALIAGHFKN